MLGSFFEWISSVVRTLRPWATVLPWEQGVIIWAGKKKRLVGPGFYFKVPFLHTVLVYPIRTRTTTAPLQTLRTLDNRTVTVGIITRYRISDLLLCLDTLHSPDATLVSIAMGHVSDYVNASNANEVTPENLSRFVTERTDPKKYGMEDFEVMVSDNADLSQRTFRLLQGDRWLPGNSMDELARPQ